MSVKNYTTEQINETIFDLDNRYLEHDRFVEIAGDFYCASDCNTCPFSDKCEFEITEQYIDFVPPLRSIIKTNDKSEPYSILPQDITQQPDSTNRYEGTTLPANNKRVFKVIKSLPDPYKDNEIEHIVYHPVQEKYYCIRQLCKTCPYYKNGCESELEFHTDKSLLYANDIRAQEPKGFLLTTLVTNNFEKLWANTFENDSIKSLGKIYSTLENLFRQAGIDTSIDNRKFFRWVNTMCFTSKEILFKLQHLSNTYYKDKTETNRNNLIEYAKFLLDSYNLFDEHNLQKEI